MTLIDDCKTFMDMASHEHCRGCIGLFFCKDNFDFELP